MIISLTNVISPIILKAIKRQVEHLNVKNLKDALSLQAQLQEHTDW